MSRTLERLAMNPSYECPKCDEYVEILSTTPEHFNCPWCGQSLRLSTDAEFEDGMWHDLSRLVTAGSHWDEKP